MCCTLSDAGSGFSDDGDDGGPLVDLSPLIHRVESIQTLWSVERRSDNIAPTTTEEDGSTEKKKKKKEAVKAIWEKIGLTKTEGGRRSVASSSSAHAVYITPPMTASLHQQRVAFVSRFLQRWGKETKRNILKSGLVNSTLPLLEAYKVERSKYRQRIMKQTNKSRNVKGNINDVVHSELQRFIFTASAGDGEGGRGGAFHVASGNDTEAGKGFIQRRRRN